jgi:hypothetical protein
VDKLEAIRETLLNANGIHLERGLEQRILDLLFFSMFDDGLSSVL